MFVYFSLFPPPHLHVAKITKKDTLYANEKEKSIRLINHYCLCKDTRYYWISCDPMWWNGTGFYFPWQSVEGSITGQSCVRRRTSGVQSALNPSILKKWECPRRSKKEYCIHARSSIQTVVERHYKLCVGARLTSSANLAPLEAERGTRMAAVFVTPRCKNQESEEKSCFYIGGPVNMFRTKDEVLQLI
ncbi:uncharacterized protein LOC133558047 isoform X2 [Nerophis ophidion]|uniref:uncharacterized protein LOC133558047 isoform X2 n=1 Tax=Nerophis ophidion TaxID=159077 RepID=UPI002ADFD2A2|nr:uncharacterized protein LOC133558047 isoform X2 [Nerophis ophidion]